MHVFEQLFSYAYLSSWVLVVFVLLFVCYCTVGSLLGIKMYTHIVYENRRRCVPVATVPHACVLILHAAAAADGETKRADAAAL